MRFFILTAVIFLTGLTGAMSRAEAETFTVRHAEGENVVLRAGQTQWLKLEAGETLHLGDRVVSSEGGVLQIESSRGILELTDSTDVLIRSLALGKRGGPVVLELASGQMKGDWSSDRQSPLTIQLPGGEFQVESGFFSLWIYALLGKPYTRVDLFRGEGFLQETSADIPLAIMAGQHMTTGSERSQGPREAPVIPGFDAFEIDPAAEKAVPREVLKKDTQAAVAALPTH
jgi:hypothetical protein